MSWNGSDISPDKNGAYAKVRSRRTPVDATSSSRHLKDGKKPLSPSPLRLFRLILILLLLGAAVALLHYLFFRTPTSNQQPATRNQQPPAAPTNRVETPPPAKLKDRYARMKSAPTYRDARGILRWEGGMRVFDPENPPKCYVAAAPKEPHLNFKHDSENDIAGILMIEPGEDLIGEIEYGADFDADFAKSLEEPIVIPEDASDYDKALMREVQSVKEELAADMAKGLSPAKKLTEARLELQRLAGIRQNLEAQVAEVFHNENISDDELNDYVKAANQILTEHGAREIRTPSFVKRNVALQLAGKKTIEKRGAFRAKQEGADASAATVNGGEAK